VSEQVREMFSSIAPRYDVTNVVLSLGVDRHWRRVAVRESGAAPGARVLDCATGTGDLALALRRAVEPGGTVLGMDFCAAMLEPAREKARRAGLEDVRFEVADALALPYPAGAFDIATIGFGIRNVDEPVRCLKEMSRVVRPGGRVVVLEFGQPSGVWGALYRLYSRALMPAVGGLLTGNRSAYAYLPRTAAAFPAGEQFLGLMDAADTFSARRAISLTGGIAFVYVGEVRAD
jgi:demethylmenaquinone methyltransferase / 2-methoxy-6-polyprenyl-1,4-benzoquinol methylase